MIAITIVNVLFMCFLICPCGCEKNMRTFPTNYLLLGGFTITEGLLVGIVCAHYTAASIFFAVIACAVVVGGGGGGGQPLLIGVGVAAEEPLLRACECPEWPEWPWHRHPLHAGPGGRCPVEELRRPPNEWVPSDGASTPATPSAEWVPSDGSSTVPTAAAEWVRTAALQAHAVRCSTAQLLERPGDEADGRATVPDDGFCAAATEPVWYSDVRVLADGYVFSR